MSKTSLIFRKPDNKCIAGEEVCVMKKERVVNLSTIENYAGSFLVLENN